MFLSRIIYSNDRIKSFKDFNLLPESKISKICEFQLLRRQHISRRQKIRRKRKTRNRRKKTWNKVKLLTWNIEGQKSVQKSCPELTIFENADIICLTETLSCDEFTIKDYYTFHVPAIKLQRGRPIGGISISVKAGLNPKLFGFNESRLIVETNIGVIYCYYFNPNSSLDDIIADITEDLMANVGNAIVTGDFNCRIDMENERGRQGLIDTFSLLGFDLVQNVSLITYVSHNGKSCIDLVFINTRVKKSIISCNTLFNPIRKHQRVLTSFRVKPSNVLKIKEKPSMTRKINLPLFQRLLQQVPLNGSNIEEFEKFTKMIKKASTISNRKQFIKPWFDDECKLLKGKCILLLINGDIDEYKIYRKRYKILIKSKRQQYEENKLIEKLHSCNNEPWKLFRKPAVRNNHILPNEWEKHFHLLLSNEVYTSEISFSDDTNGNEWYNNEITLDEIEASIYALKHKKAPGEDNVTNEHIKSTFPFLKNWYKNILNFVFDSHLIPEFWKTSNVKTLFKGKGKLSDPNAYRGIALLCTQYKLLTKVLNNRLVKHIENKLPEQQYGFRKNKSCDDAISKLINEISLAIQNSKGAFYVTFIDFEKVFDLLDRKILCKKLNMLGVKGKFFNLIVEILRINFIKVDNGNEISKKITQKRGVIQGDTLSPTLFLIYVSDLPEFITSSEVRCIMYADDLVIFSRNLMELQSSIDKLYEWCINNKLKINISKTKIIKFRKGGRLKKNDSININGTPIEFLNEYDYLGIKLQTTLTFTKHVKSKATKMAQVINSIEHLQKISLKTAEKIYNIKIWPAVTYGFKAFSHLLNCTQLHELDKIKSRFFKKVLGLPKNASNTFTLHLSETRTMGEDIIQAFKISSSTISEYRRIKEEKNMQF
ncbi:uncharacterized protein B4U79_09248, partial [Dinothrombium tinctorium]